MILLKIVTTVHNVNATL